MAFRIALHSFVCVHNPAWKMKRGESGISTERNSFSNSNCRIGNNIFLVLNTRTHTTYKMWLFIFVVSFFSLTPPLSLFHFNCYLCLLVSFGVHWIAFLLFCFQFFVLFLLCISFLLVCLFRSAFCVVMQLLSFRLIFSVSFSVFLVLSFYFLIFVVPCCLFATRLPVYYPIVCHLNVFI